MENRGNKYSIDKKQRDLDEVDSITGDNLIIPGDEATNNENFNDQQSIDLTDEEIAQQEFTVREGYNHKKPNLYEEPIIDKQSDDIQQENDTDEEALDDDGKPEVENDEFDNPADTFENDFQETEEVLEDIDEEEEDEKDKEEEENY